ncbi:MAG: MBL fold metallo-hydrolase [Candidatus Thorarchaeota archaeon]
MSFSRNTKIGLVLIITALVIGTPLLVINYLGQPLQQNEVDDTIDDFVDPQTQIIADGLVNITLLDWAGVMIEWNYTRIYIDPYLISSNYSAYPADLILITHHHPDHYSFFDIRDVENNDTQIVIPASMDDKVERHDALAVKPGDSFMFEGINITAFPMYVQDYPSGAHSAHPIDGNYTSYIIDIDGFVIFHGGDAKYMDEYEQLTGKIDVALLAIYFDPGYGPLNNSLLPIIEAIEMIQPEYCIPTHMYNHDDEIFMDEYVPTLTDDCEVMNIGFYGFRVFSLES